MAGGADRQTKLGELLVEAGLLDAAQLAAGLAEQKRWGNRLGVTLVRMGFLEEEELVRALAVQLGLPVARLRGKRVAPDALEMVPRDLADKHRCLPLFLRGEGVARTLYLAMEDPLDLESLDDVSFRLGVKTKPVLVTTSELEDALHRHYYWDPGSSAAPEALPASDSELPDLVTVRRVTEEAEDRAPDEPRVAGAAIGSQAILKALTQVLIEKGILTREELVARLSSVGDD